MLLSLRIRDFVIVDALELNFETGFTALTGETGAGKSIILDALGLLLGERGEASLVRIGQTRTELEAEFDIQGLPFLQTWLNDHDFQTEDTICLLRRSIDSQGRSRQFINGRSSTLQQLRELGEELLAIHGQHAHQTLLKPQKQRAWLDAYANQTMLAEGVNLAWRDWQALKQKRLQQQQHSQQLHAEREELAWQIEELSALGLTADTWQTLHNEHQRLNHAASLIEGAQIALTLISERDFSALNQLNQAVTQLNRLTQVDAGLQESLNLLGSAEISLREAVYSLNHYLQALELDPQRLVEIDQQIETIHHLARKYRVQPEALPDLLHAAQLKLSQINALDDAELAKAEQAAQHHYQTLATQLSQARYTAAQQLSEQTTASMQNLALAGGQFSVALLPETQGHAYGLEQVEFQVSPHVNIPLAPLHKIASGGELSRISLALQVALSQVAHVPTLIFDEVDVGIGGRVAEMVGKLMHELGQAHQVLCVTHLPQVAACAHQQWQVNKILQNETVVSRINRLSEKQRVDEIARMLGGSEITPTTLAHAAEMLEKRL